MTLTVIKGALGQQIATDLCPNASCEWNSITLLFVINHVQYISTRFVHVKIVRKYSRIYSSMP